MAPASHKRIAWSQRSVTDSCTGLSEWRTYNADSPAYLFLTLDRPPQKSRHPSAVTLSPKSWLTVAPLKADLINGLVKTTAQVIIMRTLMINGRCFGGY